MKGDDKSRNDEDKHDKNKTNKDTENQAVRVELKYCERCGSLWLRECGAGVVYCGNCQPEVAELPAPKKKPERVKMPVRRHTAVEDYRGAGFKGDLSLNFMQDVDVQDAAVQNIERDDLDFEAAGGVA
jgi:hypothetical protein